MSPRPAPTSRPSPPAPTASPGCCASPPSPRARGSTGWCRRSPRRPACPGGAGAAGGGGVAQDAEYVARLRRLIEEHGLRDRIELAGPQAGAELDASYAAADLMV